MRRISAFTTIGALIAVLAIQPMAADATPHRAGARHHRHATTRTRRHVARKTSRHAGSHHRKTTARSSAGRTRTARDRATDRARTARLRAEQRRTRARAGDARLRALAVSRPDCLSSLDPESRTLFTLRAGLNGSPQSRVAVARTLGLSPLREQLLEQISLLEFQGSTGGICAGQIAGDTLRPTIRLTSTAPWLDRGTT
jgi:hypothetical protein